MRVLCWAYLLCVVSVTGFVTAATPISTLVNRAIAAAGGEDKLLNCFVLAKQSTLALTREKAPERVSVYEPPAHWWTGKNERVKDETKPDEPAIYLVWAWTLRILTDPASELQIIPDVVESDKPAVGCE